MFVLLLYMIMNRYVNKKKSNTQANGNTYDSRQTILMKCTVMFVSPIEYTV